jgi:hypothetical protein
MMSPGDTHFTDAQQGNIQPRWLVSPAILTRSRRFSRTVQAVEAQLIVYTPAAVRTRNICKAGFSQPESEAFYDSSIDFPCMLRYPCDAEVDSTGYLTHPPAHWTRPCYRPRNRFSRIEQQLSQTQATTTFK